ncbi:hypothetical protein J6590_039679 [Homalodisca vitripennis]|nr:hypothetical protein J6590_039679 [Homalodisca vitripennis]
MAVASRAGHWTTEDKLCHNNVELHSPAQLANRSERRDRLGLSQLRADSAHTVPAQSLRAIDATRIEARLCPTLSSPPGSRPILPLHEARGRAWLSQYGSSRLRILMGSISDFKPGGEKEWRG